MIEWKFEEYGEHSTEYDPSSEKFFRDARESDSLIREFVQNSLDAHDKESKPVRVIFNTPNLKKQFKQKFLDQNFQKHLESIEISLPRNGGKFIVLEDFHTKGLEESHLKDFLYKDNITHKAEGGGSHGIGKAVFSALSRIKTFFVYSVFDEDHKKKQIFQGRCVLKSHSLNNKQYRPYGNLNIPINMKDNDNIDQVNEVFKRKSNEKGLSVAIPYCNISKEDIEKSCLDQCYWPIVDKKLEIEIGDKKITQDTLLGENHLQTQLAYDYKTCSGDQIKEYTIKHNQWKKREFPQIKENITEENQSIFISFKIELPIKNNSSTKENKYGKMAVLIKKKERPDEQNIDFWRDHLLINKALGGHKKEEEYSMIIIVKDDPLSKLLRQLEDPGHTKWQIGSIHEEIEKNYHPTYVKELIRFIKKLPLNIIKQMKYQSIEQDSHFFADYFPDTPFHKDKKPSSNGDIDPNSSGNTNDNPDIEPKFQDFNYTKHRDGKGFTLRLKPSHQEQYPDQVTVTVAYGTNIGNAFKHYDKRDFNFKENIKVIVDDKFGKSIVCNENSAQYQIIDKKFSISLTGFDPDRELKIEVK